MHLKLPPSLSICLGTCAAGLLLGLQNENEYCQQLESNHPKWGGIAECFHDIAHRTGLPQLFQAEKKLLSNLADQMPLIGNTETQEPSPPPTPRVIYVRVPALSDLNTLRLPRKEQEKTLNPADLISEPSSDLLKEHQPTSTVQSPEPVPTPQPPSPEPIPEPTPPAPPAPVPVPQPEPAPPVQEEIPAVVTAEDNEKKPVRCRIMLLGDSLMEDLGPTTHRNLRHRKGLYFILTAKYSTGLSRPDYFNWPENMQKTVERTKPDIIIFFMGANDGMPIKVNGKNVYPNSGAAWRKAYREKMAEMFAIGRAHGCDMLWVGLPPMGSRYAKILAQTAQAQHEGCAENSITFVDTAPVLGDKNGNFRTYMTDNKGNTVRLRAKDKEHLSPMGNKLVMEAILPVLEQKIANFRTKHPERCLSEKEVKMPGRAPLEITIKYIPGKR